MQTHLLFWQYKSKINKKGLAPLYLRITVDRRKTEYATGQSIEPEKWDSANGMVKATLKLRLSQILPASPTLHFGTETSVEEKGLPSMGSNPIITLTLL